MKKRMLWKIVAALCLVALIIPFFPALTATQVDATTNAPYPWAMEAYGQAHSRIYTTKAAPAVDGRKEESYTDLGKTGSFISSAADGSNATSPASEYLPKKVELYASYDEDNIYFFVSAVVREGEAKALNVKLGSTFSEKQTDAQLGTVKSFSFDGQATKTVPAAQTGEGFAIQSTYYDTYQDSTNENGYETYKTDYEFVVSFDELGLQGPADRLYFSASFGFSDDAFYWFWGVPNSTMLPTDESVGSALAKDGLESAAFTPNVLEFMGEKNETTSYAPEITNVIRTDSFGDAKRTFRAMATLNLASEKVKSAGMLYAKTATVGGKHLEKGVAEEAACTDVVGTAATNFDGTITIGAEDYNTFYSIRPYVVLKDDSVLYGSYYTLSSLYFDSANTEYPRGEMSILMIGCSFNFYHLNELVSLCKSAGLHLTAGNVYRSGAPAVETWEFLVNDGATWTFYLRTPDDNFADGNGAQSNRTIKQCLEAVEHWDMITVQDHYGIDVADSLTQCVDKSMPYLPNVFRYLEVNYPTSRLYLNQTWAFQPGYNWTKNSQVILDSEGNVDPAQNTPENTNAASRMNTVEQQTRDWGNIKACTEYICTSTGINMVPSGSAWQLARHKTYTLSGGGTCKIGDVLCNKGPDGDSTKGDYYHDGSTGGGQYLNACVLFEILTGENILEIPDIFVPDGTNNTDGYAISAERAEALRMAAHEAVAACREAGLTDHFGK